MLRHILVSDSELSALDSIVEWSSEEMHARWDSEETGENIRTKTGPVPVHIMILRKVIDRLEKQQPQMTDDQKSAVQQVVAHMWNDEHRDFESNPDDGHIFTSLVRLRDFLEQEGIEPFPEPNWHKVFVEGEAQGAPVSCLEV